MQRIYRIVLVPAVAAALTLGACEKKSSNPPPAGPQTKAPQSHDGHDHDHGVTLGTRQIGGYEVAAALEGKAQPGKEAHVEITLTGGAGKPAAVRVWIGAQDAAGSVKSKADSEDHGYHAHADVPDPLPAGSRLWVEIEDAAGKVALDGFDLKD